MTNLPIDPSELKEGELHPSVTDALKYVSSLPTKELLLWQESFSSCAIEGNRLAEVCSGTLQRLMSGQPVGERYLLGLVTMMALSGTPKKEGESYASQGNNLKQGNRGRRRRA